MDDTVLATIVICSTFGFIITFHIIQYFRVIIKPTVVYGSAESEALVKRCPTLNNFYYPFFFTWGRNSLLAISALYFEFQRYMEVVKWTTETFAMEDGQEITVDWAVSPCINAESGLNESLSNTPILIIQHGGMCYSKNLPGQGWVHEAHKKGWIVCCQHRRWTKCSLSIPKINIFGSSSDIKFFLENYVLKRRPNAKILMVGISAGSGLLGRFLGEEGNSKHVTAAMGLCPGYDIRVCMNRGGSLWGNYLTASVKEFYLERNLELFRSFEGFDKCMKAKDVQEYLDNAYAIAGFETSFDYYKHCNPVEVMANITAPFMLINSEDDPICVYQNALENINLFKNSPSLIFVGTKTGTHCCFWECFSTKSWAERATFEFFEACLLRDMNAKKKSEMARLMTL